MSTATVALSRKSRGPLLGAERKKRQIEIGVDKHRRSAPKKAAISKNILQPGSSLEKRIAYHEAVGLEGFSATQVLDNTSHLDFGTR